MNFKYLLFLILFLVTTCYLVTCDDSEADADEDDDTGEDEDQDESSSPTSSTAVTQAPTILQSQNATTAKSLPDSVSIVTESSTSTTSKPPTTTKSEPVSATHASVASTNDKFRPASEMLDKSIRATVENIKPLIKTSDHDHGHNEASEKHSSDPNEDDEEEIDDEDEDEEEVEEKREKITYSSTVANANETIAVLAKVSKIVSTGIEGLFRESIPLVASLGYDSDLSSECLASLLKLFNGIRKQQTWAFRLLDSYGRIAPGTFDGSVTEFGEYNQCLDINFPIDEPILDDVSEPDSDLDIDEPVVVGKYCIMRIDIPMPPRPEKLSLHHPTINVTGTQLEGTILDYLSRTLDHLYSIKGFRYGICIPSSCSASELEAIVNKVIHPVLNTPVYIGPDKHCDSRLDTFTFNFKQKVALVIILIFVSLTVIGTVFDVCRSISLSQDRKPRTKYEVSKLEVSKLEVSKFEDKPSMTSQLIMAFSIVFNTRKLFHIREDREETLSAIHGMRIISMIWIIIGHTYCFGGFYKILYTFKRVSVAGIENPARWAYQPLINTFLLVETFFFLGGVVLIYVALPMLSKHKGKFNYAVYVIHRWVRLTPAMIGTIAFITIMPVFGSGPIWKKEMTWQSEGCQKNWWMNILYISNWVYPVDEMCGGMTWFVAADFQIYLFAPLIFFSYYKSTILGVSINVLILMCGMFSSGLSVYVNEIAPTFGLQHTIDLQLLHQYAQFGYFPTYHHIGPYAIGTLIGFLILKNRDNPIYIPRLLQVILWIVAPLCSISVLICTQPWNDYHNQSEPSRVTSVIFSVFQRVLWCCGISWVSFSCATGRGGIVNDILSWKAFVPFSRLSYSIYMVHLIPIFLRVNAIRYTRPWDDFEFVSTYANVTTTNFPSQISWGVFNIFLGIIGAYLLYIVFESPINNLEKIIFRPVAIIPAVENNNNKRTQQHSA